MAFLGTLIKAKRASSSSSTPPILDTYPAPVAYSLEYLSTSFVGNPVVTVRRSSDNSTSSFTPSQITSTDNTAGNLLNFTPDAFTGSGCKFSNLNRNLFITSDNVDLRVTGDLTIIGHMKLDTYTSGAQAIVTKYGTAGNRGYQVRINGSGRLAFLWSEDGTNQLSVNSAVMPVSGGDEVCFKIDFDVDNGAGGRTITFSLSSDGGQTFTQFDQAVETGTTQIFPSTDTLELMLTSQSAGEVYRLTIKDGIDGVDVFDADFTSRPALSGEFTENTGKVVTPNFTECFITDWHNQGTLAASADVTQLTAGSQPLIYDSVNGLIRGANGKPAISFDGIDDNLNCPLFSSNVENDWVFAVTQRDSNERGAIFKNGNNNNGWAVGYGGNNFDEFGDNIIALYQATRWLPTGYSTNTTLNSLIASHLKNTDLDIYQNGTEISPVFTGAGVNAPSDIFYVGGYANRHLKQTMQEFVFFTSDQTANRSAIETDINNRYTIY